MPKHFYHRAEQQYHPVDEMPYDSSSTRRENSYSFDTALGNHRSFGESGRNANDSYSAGRYPPIQANYENNAVPMPALPPIGMAKSPIFPPTNHSMPYPTNSKINERHTAIYRNSPHFSVAPTIDYRMEGLFASGSSESSTTSTNPNRPAPAKSAFMCFSFAKREEMMKRVGSSGGVRALVDYSLRVIVEIQPYRYIYTLNDFFLVGRSRQGTCQGMAQTIQV